MYSVDFFKEIDSTSAYARKNLANLPDLKVIGANLQTNGHGQFEKKWFSSDKNGGNCYISIVLKPKNIEYLNELTQYTSLIVAKTLQEYSLAPKLKYPNDVLINDKKIAGILAESVFLGNTFNGVIVGIGVNLNLDSNELNKINIEATSIYNETKKSVDKDEFIQKLLDIFFKSYENFLKNGKVAAHQIQDED